MLCFRYWKKKEYNQNGKEQGGLNKTALYDKDGNSYDIRS